jgi:hypothetical protein
LKTDDWATEFEYRAVLLAPEDEYAFVSYRDTLAAVVLGDHFPDWQVSGAREVCDEAGAALCRVRWLQGRPRCVRLSATSEES